MLIDTTPVSRWYVLSKGFKVYEACPKCQSSQVQYFKVREPGFAGIKSQCADCNKEMPVRMKANQIMPRKIAAAI